MNNTTCAVFVKLERGHVVLALRPGRARGRARRFGELPRGVGRQAEGDDEVPAFLPRDAQVPRAHHAPQNERRLQLQMHEGEHTHPGGTRRTAPKTRRVVRIRFARCVHSRGWYCEWDFNHFWRERNIILISNKQQCSVFLTQRCRS